MDKDDKEELLDKYKAKVTAIASRAVAPGVLKVIDEEMTKLSALEKNSAEFNVTRTYLDWLTAVPWGLFTTDRLSLREAKVVLDQDHFGKLIVHCTACTYTHCICHTYVHVRFICMVGLEEVKKRILEFIAIGKMKKSVKGKIICLIGPPGVGTLNTLLYACVFRVKVLVHNSDRSFLVLVCR